MVLRDRRDWPERRTSCRVLIASRVGLDGSHDSKHWDAVGITSGYDAQPKYVG